MTPGFEFLELDKKCHDRESFDCGERDLNLFLQKSAARHRAANISKTMVLPAQESERDICAFYTLSHTQIERQLLPPALSKKLPTYPVPVLLIAQLAVDKRVQKLGVGKITLVRALKHCRDINPHLPSFAVIVDAINEHLVSFYAQYGFQHLHIHNDHTRMFLPMNNIP